MNLLELVKIVPTIILVLSLISSLIYFCAGDYKNGLYWLAAFTLNVSVVYL